MVQLARIGVWMAQKRDLDVEVQKKTAWRWMATAAHHGELTRGKRHRVSDAQADKLPADSEPEFSPEFTATQLKLWLGPDVMEASERCLLAGLRPTEVQSVTGITKARVYYLAERLGVTERVRMAENDAVVRKLHEKGYAYRHIMGLTGLNKSQVWEALGRLKLSRAEQIAKAL